MTRQTSGHLPLHSGQSDVWKKRSALDFSLKSPPVSTLSSSPPPGRIWSAACAGLGAGWGGQTGRLAGLQIVFPRLSLWVDSRRLLARPCSSPRGLSFCWKCDAAAQAHVGVCLQRPRSASPPPTHLLRPHLSPETGGAKRGVTIVSGMPGRHGSASPAGLYLPSSA